MGEKVANLPKAKTAKKQRRDYDDFVPLPDLGPKGRILCTTDNLYAVLRHHGMKVRYNVVRKCITYDLPELRVHDDEKNNVAITVIRDHMERAGVPTGQVKAQLMAVAAANYFNPFLEMVESRPWDGRSRFEDLAATVTLESDDQRELWLILLKRWLTSVVASQTKKGFWSKGVLTLQGDQSLGKTSWFARLFADDPDAFNDGQSLNLAEKDSILKSLKYVVCELGELDGTFHKSHIAALKAHLSSKRDEHRRAFAETDSEYSRRTVYCASVNGGLFLMDETGNSRFWAVGVTALDYHHNIDMQQMWAEVATWVENGERWWLEPDEQALLDKQSQKFEITDSIFERFARVLDPSRQGPIREFTVSELLAWVMGINNPGKSHLTKAGCALRKLGFKPVDPNARPVVYRIPQYWADNSSPWEHLGKK